MTLPLLDYKPTTQNQRVPSFGLADINDDIAFIYRLEDAASSFDIDELIQAAYRQVFNEQEMLRFNRQIVLETQLKNHTITVRDFIRGLAKSKRFYELVVAPNNNYRLVELCFKRFLGRAPYNKEEEIAWSIQIATLGWDGFVDALINSDEYEQVFGDGVVPYQRKRMAERPFSFTPRYGADYRDKLPAQGASAAQFGNFHLQTFVRQANWPVVAGLLLTSVGLIGFLLLISSLAAATGR